LLYPLSYEGGGCRNDGGKPGEIPQPAQPDVQNECSTRPQMTIRLNRTEDGRAERTCHWGESGAKRLERWAERVDRL
jgi:hypothetical protein